MLDMHHRAWRKGAFLEEHFIACSMASMAIPMSCMHSCCAASQTCEESLCQPAAYHDQLPHLWHAKYVLTAMCFICGHVPMPSYLIIAYPPDPPALLQCSRLSLDTGSWLNCCAFPISTISPASSTNTFADCKTVSLRWAI